MTERLFSTDQPSLVLVIGTFAALPYIHLQLESRRRFYPEIPCIVHDDCSPLGEQLQELCGTYGAEFYATPVRHGHQPGDTHALLHGILRAAERGADLLVKFSRSFIPLADWRPQLQQLAVQSQYATYSNKDDGYGLGFRTECIAFHPPSWLSNPSYQTQMEQVVQNGTGKYGGVEIFLHGLAREVHRATQCCQNREYERLNPSEEGVDAYGTWPWIGTDRKQRQAALLWHHADLLLDYYRLALAYGLPYRPNDFVDPNYGLGIGE